MNRRQVIATLVMLLLILVGMIGLYYGLWRAWQIYQEKSAQLSTPKGILGLLGFGPKPPANP